MCGEVISADAQLRVIGIPAVSSRRLECHLHALLSTVVSKMGIVGGVGRDKEAYDLPQRQKSLYFRVILMK